MKLTLVAVHSYAGLRTPADANLKQMPALSTS